MSHLELPDCRLFYQVDDYTDPWSRAEPILFVHGFAECTEAWRAWVPHVSRRYRMIRFDQRGFGQSGPVPADFSYSSEGLVDDLVRIINHVAGEPVHLVAGKSGGFSSMVLAATRPDLLKTLTLCCSPHEPPKVDAWPELMASKGMRHWARQTMRSRLGSKIPERGIDWWVDMMGATAVSTAQAYMRWVPTVNVADHIPQISCPTLVIGTDTPWRGRSEYEQWQPRIRNSELKILPIDGYHASGTNPDETAALTLDFIARQGAPR